MSKRPSKPRSDSADDGPIKPRKQSKTNKTPGDKKPVSPKRVKTPLLPYEIEAAPTQQPGDRYFDILVQLKQIDPSVSPDGIATEETRDSLNTECLVPVTTSAKTDVGEEESSPPIETDRSRRIEAELSEQLDVSLKKLAEEWQDKTKQLARESAIHAAAGGVRLAADMQSKAERLTQRAFKSLHVLWSNYALTDVEVAKELTKKLIWATILVLIDFLS